MSLADLGKNDISEETQALKDRLASQDTECAGLRTQLMRREAELEELRVTLNETVYKLSKEAERALKLEEEVSTQSSELKTERISLRNTELALQSTQERLKTEERTKRELEATLDTVSLHSQTTSAEHQSIQREKRALESRVRELERIVQTHESRRVSNIPHKSGRPRSSSVSNFRLPAVEQELNDVKTQLHIKDTNLQALEQKFAQAQDNLVMAENARISIDKAGQKRVSELLLTLEKKEEELESLRETDNTGEREEELLKRIDEDAAKIAALEHLVAESQATRTSEARIRKLQSQLKAECEKVHRSENLCDRLLQEKEELARQYDASQREILEGQELLIARESQIKELESKHAHFADFNSHPNVPFDGECYPRSSRPNGAPVFASESALADHIQTLLEAVDRLRGERDGLERALEFSEVEYRITTEGFQSRIASLTTQLAASTNAIAVGKPPIGAYLQQRTKQMILCAAAFGLVISNLQTHLDLSEDRLSVTTADLAISNSKLHDALAVIDSRKQSLVTNASEHAVLLHQFETAKREISSSNEERNRLRFQLIDAEEQVATLVERAKASEAAREETHQSFLLAEERFVVVNKHCQEVESERNTLALQIKNLQDDLAHAHEELTEGQNRYSTLHAQQLSAMSTSEAMQALKDRIQELEARIVYFTDQIGDYQHDICRLEANVKLHEEHIAEMVPELELLASEKATMIEDCAEAREARDEAIGRLEAAEEEAERSLLLLQQTKHASDGELLAMSSTVENLKSENQRTTARLEDLEAENTKFIRELDTLNRDHERLNEQLNVAVSSSQSLELEVSKENAQMRQAIVSFAIIHRAYKDSAQQLQRSCQRITILESQLSTLNQRLSGISGATDKSQDDLLTSKDLRPESERDYDVGLLRDALQEKDQELAVTRQMLEETKNHYSEVERELLRRIATMTTDSTVQAEDIANLQAELEDIRTQLQISQQNFIDLEKHHCDVIQEFTTVKEVFEHRLAETDEQIRVLDADHKQNLSAMEIKYRRDTDSLANNLEDREHEVDALRHELQDALDVHACAEGKLREELKSYEARQALLNDLENDLRQSIADTHQRLTQAEVETLALQEERQSLRAEITGLQAEIQRLMSLTRYLETQVKESENACILLKENLQRSELSLAESEKAGKMAEFNLTLQATQHEKVVTVLRREIASFQSGPELRSALDALAEKNREMDDLLRAKCQEIEEYDDRILETLKVNKKLMSKVESLTRKTQTLQAKISSFKNPSREPESIHLKASTCTPPPSVPTSTQADFSTVRKQESSVPPLTLRSKTPEPRPQSAVAIPSSLTPDKMIELAGCEMSAGKKRPAPDDDERDSVPAEGHYSTDAHLRNGPTPRLRRTHGHPAGFTPVRGASRKPAGQPSPERRLNVGVMPSEIITDVTNSPRGSSRPGDSQLKKKSWLGKIRGGTGSQTGSSRLGTFGGQ